jgi:hypothetical protein
MRPVQSNCGRQIILEGEEPKDDIKICFHERYYPANYPGFCNASVAATCPNRCEVSYSVRHTLDGTICWFGNMAYVESTDLNPEGD